MLFPAHPHDDSAGGSAIWGDVGQGAPPHWSQYWREARHGGPNGEGLLPQGMSAVRLPGEWPGQCMPVEIALTHMTATSLPH